MDYHCNITNPTGVEFKTDEELFIESWLTKIGKLNVNAKSGAPVEKGGKVKSEMKIHCAKRELYNCLGVIDELKLAQSNLRENLATMSSTEWKTKTVEIGVLKDKLTLAMSHFSKPEALTALKKSLARRSKKRVAKRNRRREIKQNREDECSKAHQKVDQWLENMKESVERVKAEENMKKDADCVLAEVTKKKADAKKQLALLAALNKLRDIREAVARQRGGTVCEDDREAFRDTAEMLTSAWDNCLKTYVKEEQGLRIMLEQNEEGTKKSCRISDKDKKIAADWERALFGARYVPESDIYWGLTLADRDFETFVAIRKSWDTFLCRSASKIPPGWVLPTNSSSEWNKYLQN